MKPTDKYLHAMRATWIRDTEELSDAGLDAMLGTTGSIAGTAKRNPNPLTATCLVELLGVIIKRSNRRLDAAAEVFGLDLERLRETAEAAEHGGEIDRVTANMIALARELARRGPTAKPLTKWILANGERFRNVMAECGRERMCAEIIGYFEGGNSSGQSNPEYAQAIRQYFDPRREEADTECKLLACCVLLGWDYEAMAEKAAVLEYDAGMPRTTATMKAVWYALRDQQPGISEMTAQLFFDLASQALEVEQSQDWPRSQTIEWIFGQMHGAPVNVLAPCPSQRVAV